MYITRDGVQLDIITLRYDSKCTKCGGKILAGTQACWLPKSKWSHGRGRVKTHSGVLINGTPLTSRMRYPSDAKMVGTVTHHPDSPCANEYRVKIVYDCTAKTLVITAYNAELALDAVCKQVARNRRGINRTTRADVAATSDNWSPVLHSSISLPNAYIVYQGNIPVLTRLQKDIRI